MNSRVQVNGATGEIISESRGWNWLYRHPERIRKLEVNGHDDGTATLVAYHFDGNLTAIQYNSYEVCKHQVINHSYIARRNARFAHCSLAFIPGTPRWFNSNGSFDA